MCWKPKHIEMTPVNSKMGFVGHWNKKLPTTPLTEASEISHFSSDTQLGCYSKWHPLSAAHLIIPGMAASNQPELFVVFPRGDHSRLTEMSLYSEFTQDELEQGRWRQLSL